MNLARPGREPPKIMTPIRKLSFCFIVGAGSFLAASSAVAYTIVFKDESTLIALEKYTIEGDVAFVTLTSGTKTTFPAAEIDVEKTDALNRLGINRGILLDSRVEEPVLGVAPSDTIADLVQGGYGALRVPEDRAAAQVSRTRAGNIDLFRLIRNSPADPALATSLKEALAASGQNTSLVFAGTSESRLLVETVTETETEVFASLAAAAAALLTVRIESPQLEALELVMATSDHSRAGQFLLTPNGARRLIDAEVSAADFFLLNVQF